MSSDLARPVRIHVCLCVTYEVSGAGGDDTVGRGVGELGDGVHHRDGAGEAVEDVVEHGALEHAHDAEVILLL